MAVDNGERPIKASNIKALFNDVPFLNTIKTKLNLVNNTELEAKDYVDNASLEAKDYVDNASLEAKGYATKDDMVTSIDKSEIYPKIFTDVLADSASVINRTYVSRDGSYTTGGSTYASNACHYHNKKFKYIIVNDSYGNFSPRVEIVTPSTGVSEYINISGITPPSCTNAGSVVHGTIADGDPGEMKWVIFMTHQPVTKYTGVTARRVSLSDDGVVTTELLHQEQTNTSSTANRNCTAYPTKLKDGGYAYWGGSYYSYNGYNDERGCILYLSPDNVGTSTKFSTEVGVPYNSEGLYVVDDGNGHLRTGNGTSGYSYPGLEYVEGLDPLIYPAMIDDIVYPGTHAIIGNLSLGPIIYIRGSEGVKTKSSKCGLFFTDIRNRVAGNVELTTSGVSLSGRVNWPMIPFKGAYVVLTGLNFSYYVDSSTGNGYVRNNVAFISPKTRDIILASHKYTAAVDGEEKNNRTVDSDTIVYAEDDGCLYILHLDTGTLTTIKPKEEI